MNVLKAVLDHELPSEWERLPEGSYNTSYKLFDVSQYSSEWYTATNEFSSLRNSINSIRRVQNPFQLGLFKIQEAKRREEYNYVNPVFGYHLIHPDDLNTAMKYPLDYRRYAHRNISLQSDEKQPRFFTSLQSAYQNGNGFQSDGETIIIKAQYFSPPRNQGDYVPVYVINVKL